MFSRPQVNIYSEDVVRSVEFYRGFGFEETFRTPREGIPIHVERTLDGFTVGIASVTSAMAEHGLDFDPGKPGRGIEIVLWTDDIDGAFARLVAAGAQALSDPHDWLGTLRVAWVADPDKNPIELVERRDCRDGTPRLKAPRLSNERSPGPASGNVPDARSGAGAQARGGAPGGHPLVPRQGH